MNNIKKLIAILFAIVSFVSCVKWLSTTYVDIKESCTWTHKYLTNLRNGDITLVFQDNNKLYVTYSKLVSKNHISFAPIYFEGSYFQTGDDNSIVIVHGYFKDEFTGELMTIESEDYILKNGSNFNGESLFVIVTNEKGEEEIWELKNSYQIHKIVFPF